MREETAIREAAAVYKETKEQPGCEFLGKILSVICSSREKKKCLEEAGKNGLPESFSPRDLADDWAKFACMQICRPGGAREDEELLRSYQNISRENKDYADEFGRYRDVVEEHKDSRKGKTTLLNSFRNIFTENKGSMPYINFGIAFTIASAACGASDINFYVGTEEAKDVLFHSLEVLGYSSAEYIPDKCFEDHDALRKLLLAALYHALQVRLPYHQGHREKNLETGRRMVESIIDSDIRSELFAAVSRVSEAEFLSGVLWRGMARRCRQDEIPYLGRKNLEEFYIFPEIVSREGNSKIMLCEKNYRLRSLVEGGTGSGKTALSKIILSVCMDREGGSGFPGRMAERLGMDGKEYLPLLLKCGTLEAREITEKNLTGCALDQMYAEVAAGNGTTERERQALRHYEECRDYLETICLRKAALGKLLLIVDDFSKLQGDAAEAFEESLRTLCRKYPALHIIVLTGRMLPSQKRIFPEFTWFSIKGFRFDEGLSEKVLRWSGNRKAEQKISRMTYEFMDTPRRFFFSMTEPGLNIRETAGRCMEEELEYKCTYDVTGEDCRAFLTALMLAAYRIRGWETGPLVIPEKIVNERFLEGLKDRVHDPRKTWDFIRRQSVLIERSGRIRSFEFHSRMYQYILMADYCLEKMEELSPAEYAAAMWEGLSGFDGRDLAYLMVMLFYRICGGDGSFSLMDIPEENIGVILKTMAGKIISFDAGTDTQFCIRALREIVSDQSLKSRFTQSVRTGYGMKLWRFVERIYHTLTHSYEFCLDSGLLT